MLIHKIIHNGREYVSSTLACEEAYVSHETLRVHANRGAVPYIEHDGRRWYDLAEVKAYFSKPTKSGHTKMYKLDDFTIGGRRITLSGGTPTDTACITASSSRCRW